MKYPSNLLSSVSFAPFILSLCIAGLFLASCPLSSLCAEEQWAEHIQLVLDNAEPLAYSRGERLPLYLWPAMSPGKLQDDQAEDLVKLLDKRGVGLVSTWSHSNLNESLETCLPVARAQAKLGLRVNINANSLIYSFCDGSTETAHIDKDGNAFFDESFGPKTMGCPFRLEHRVAPIRKRFEDFADAYKKNGLSVDFVFTDWEIDGPLEWNKAHAVAKRCRVCRENLPEIDDFLAYQHRLRLLRSLLQSEAYAEPLLERFPDTLVGNYAVYPHDGWRYWYDYFERYVEGQPYLADQEAKYRHWSNDFEGTGFTFAMPVVYPWSWTWNWYDFEQGDYRWFYNGLLVASNAGLNTPADIPIIPFVHWHTVDVGLSSDDNASDDGLEKAVQISEWAYQELLWHMLLRGADTFFLWCQQKEQKKEVQLLHPVWAEAQQYGDFLDRGTPITFEVPSEPGTVVSGLRLGDRVLVRRTDFTKNKDAVTIDVAGHSLKVPSAPDRCQILPLGK